MTSTIDAILSFWFGELNDKGLCDNDHNTMWFKSSAHTDAQCRNLFGESVSRAIAGDLDLWTTSNDGLIAMTLLLDQFTRNIYRGTAAAFSGDQRALELVRKAILENRQLHLPAIHRVFLYMPLEHSEDIETQDICVALFAELVSEINDSSIESFHRFAVAHRDVIAQFGRFPHRNAILDRQSTAEELDYLHSHGGF
ncbi:MAG: DUF924 domain-containing protein [Halieaceae bacterium]|jgi:uncharacterized protein (DUF924 family)|nr:DUF924 domain-containing protein [Halieaceae bacterium]